MEQAVQRLCPLCHPSTLCLWEQQAEVPKPIALDEVEISNTPVKAVMEKKEIPEVAAGNGGTRATGKLHSRWPCLWFALCTHSLQCDLLVNHSLKHYQMKAVEI